MSLEKAKIYFVEFNITKMKYVYLLVFKSIKIPKAAAVYAILPDFVNLILFLQSLALNL
jgi:hypothetical protein